MQITREPNKISVSPAVCLISYRQFRLIQSSLPKFTQLGVSELFLLLHDSHLLVICSVRASAKSETSFHTRASAGCQIPCLAEVCGQQWGGWALPSPGQRWLPTASWPQPGLLLWRPVQSSLLLFWELSKSKPGTGKCRGGVWGEIL